MNKEAFNPTESYLHGTMRRAIHPRVISNRNNQPRALVDAMVKVATRRRLRYVGFKIFPAHLSSGGIDAILRMQGARAVILYRKNVLAVYRSLRVAESTGHWTSTNTNRFKVRVDVGSFSHFKGQYAAWYTQAMQQVRAARVPVTIFEHSEFFANQRESLKRLQRFLELPEHYAVRASSSSSLRRQNTVPLRRSISNYASFSREVKSRYGSSVENFGSLNLAERPGRRGNY
ncbi:hypothetical protein PPROV_000807400 [Pycnococcus provasolii]|uniref:Sulfotransferase n=2 Tax=Pycnococcus provasolii TaxID=41880 RepID=A0A830HQY8_9CHLO|nr:hypothetical protein PPROV_000807400 [Pycnococcus provasolii]